MQDMYNVRERVRGMFFASPMLQTNLDLISTCGYGPQIQSSFQMALGRHM